MRVRVLVVWEPILPTDWSRPSGMVQSRISDTRVIQYWDNDHLVAGELRRQLSSEPSCCQRSGILWDLAVLYEKQAQWGNASPVFAEGPVVDAAPALEKRIATLSYSSIGRQWTNRTVAVVGDAAPELTSAPFCWILWQMDAVTDHCRDRVARALLCRARHSTIQRNRHLRCESQAR